MLTGSRTWHSSERGFINIPHLSGQRGNVCASKNAELCLHDGGFKERLQLWFGFFFFFQDKKATEKFCSSRCHAGVARLLFVASPRHSLAISAEASCFYSAVNHHQLSRWPLHSALQEQQPSDFYPVVSLSLTFMQNRNTKCWGGAETPKGTVSHEQKVRQVEKATLLTSWPPCRPPFFSIDQLCSPSTHFFISSLTTVKATFSIQQSTAEQVFRNKGSLPSFGCHW